MVLLNYLLSLLKIREDSSIMTSSMVNLWLTYLMWSALASQPDENCNSLLNSNWATVIQILSHLVWTFITLVSLSVANTEDTEKGQNVIS
jgi:predicted branched-subunit amino acid permease